MTRIRIKRVYEPAAPDDGCRVLVDKLWPRGVRKDALHYDMWAKEITPSPVSRIFSSPRNASTATLTNALSAFTASIFESRASRATASAN